MGASLTEGQLAAGQDASGRGRDAGGTTLTLPGGACLENADDVRGAVVGTAAKLRVGAGSRSLPRVPGRGRESGVKRRVTAGVYR